ncbi:MAG TPA: flagellar FliJ family protein [Acetobacteraceae bacterium]|jgi:flagellar export protein FliJ|nr:flagellar FliJ family protein [Acetobacteraceae bacterium]
MRRPDRLASLLKLRGLAVAEAQRDLADRLAGAAAAEARAAAAATAIVVEAATAGDDHYLADAYAAWLPAGRDAEMRTAGEARMAEMASEAARKALAAARVRERAVEWLRDRAIEEARREAARREQAALDEAATRRAAMRRR